MKNIYRRQFIQKISLATAAVGMIGTTACQEDNQTHSSKGPTSEVLPPINYQP